MSAGTEKIFQPSRRLGGVDAARAVAVLGMVMVHFGPTPAPDTALGGLYELPHGRASVLFVLLAGVGVALLAGGSGEAAPGRRNGVRGRLLLRAALLLPLGLWLQALDHGVLVILQFYAVYFLLALLVLALPDGLLLAGSGLALLCGTTAYLLASEAVPGLFDPYPAEIGDPAGEILRDLVLTGAYPLAVWSAPLLFGIWVGRQDLASVRIAGLLLGLGFAVGVAAAFFAAEPARASGLAELLSGEPHSQTLVWMLGSIGSGCAVLGGMLLLVGRFPGMSWPMVAVGQMALTVYVCHLLLLHTAGWLVRRETPADALLSVAVFAVLVAWGCMLWRSVFSRGPLEAAFAASWWGLRSILRRQHRPPDFRESGGP